MAHKMYNNIECFPCYLLYRASPRACVIYTSLMRCFNNKRHWKVFINKSNNKYNIMWIFYARIRNSNSIWIPLKYLPSIRDHAHEMFRSRYSSTVRGLLKFGIEAPQCLRCCCTHIIKPYIKHIIFMYIWCDEGICAHYSVHYTNLGNGSDHACIKVNTNCKLYNRMNSEVRQSYKMERMST